VCLSKENVPRPFFCLFGSPKLASSRGIGDRRIYIYYYYIHHIFFVDPPRARSHVHTHTHTKP
jgi:hypothetical protein